jgi:hypothetical protein
LRAPCAGPAGLQKPPPAAAAAATDSGLGLEQQGLVTAADFAAAMHRVGPSIVRGAAVEVAPVSWGDVGGYDEVKKRLRQAVEWPLQHTGEVTRCTVLGSSMPVHNSCDNSHSSGSRSNASNSSRG